MTIRKALLRARRWCGIGLATLVVLAGATGSLLAFHHEIDAALAPELHRVEPRTNRVSLDDIAARIEAGHPDLVVGYFLFTPEPGAAIRVIMNTRSAAHPGDPVAGVGRVESRAYCQVRFLPPGDIMDGGTIRLFVDGREGVLPGRFDHRDGTVGDRIRTWQFPLHGGQGFGLPGRILICGAGLLPLLLTGAGFWLWLRRRNLRRCAQAPVPAALPPGRAGSQPPRLSDRP